MRCLWPSRQTALSMNLLAFVERATFAIPMELWLKIPERAKRSVFLDALPNPSEPGLVAHHHPFSHAKVLIKTGGDVGVIYVGSHNFSKSAWGQTQRNGLNVEVGVGMEHPDRPRCGKNGAIASPVSCLTKLPRLPAATSPHRPIRAFEKLLMKVTLRRRFRCSKLCLKAVMLLIQWRQQNEMER